MNPAPRRAVFFDRDDTLMVNVPYLGDPAQVEAFAEAAAALAELEKAGFLIFVVSNQSGVGRGLITREQVDAVNVALVRQLGGTYIHTFYHSYATGPHDDPEDHRKPSPRLVLQAAKEHGLDLARSFFVGDRLSDIECGRRAGCRTVFLEHPQAGPRADSPARDQEAREKADHVASDLTRAAAWILAADSPASSSPRP